MQSSQGGIAAASRNWPSAVPACLSLTIIFLSVRLIGDQEARISLNRTSTILPAKEEMICMRLITNLLAGLLFTGMLALAPDTSFARGGGGGGHFGGGGGGGGHFAGFHGGFGSRGFGDRGHGFHGFIGHRGDGGDYYGDYGLDDYDYYAAPFYDDNDSFDAPTATIEGVPGEGTSFIMSVQKELTELGYYHGAIDGISGAETEHAVRWFQAVNHLPVTGRIDSATMQALRIA